MSILVKILVGLARVVPERAKSSFSPLVYLRICPLLRRIQMEPSMAMLLALVRSGAFSLKY